MDQLTLIGTIAAILCTFSFLPQAIKTIRTRDTSALSLPTYMVFFTGVAFWAYYGYLSGIASILIGNSITLVLAGIILFFKIIEKSHQTIQIMTKTFDFKNFQTNFKQTFKTFKTKIL